MHAFPIALFLLLLSAPCSASQSALNDKLYEAVLYNDPAAVAALLAQGDNVNHKVNDRSVLG